MTRRAVEQGQPVAIPDMLMVRDADAADTKLPRHYQALLAVPVIQAETVYGAITLYYTAVQPFSEDDTSLAVTFADQVALVIENTRLRAQAEHSAVLAERNRLARDLHDAVTQTLFAASLIADVLPRLWKRNPEEAARRLDELRDLTRGALAEMRTLLLELRPTALSETDFPDLLRQLADAFQGRARVLTEVTITGPCALPPDTKLAFYRIAQEALNNIARHANATRATIRLDCQPESVRLHIADDGAGFDLDAVPPDHLGLTIMRERAATIEADLTITSQPGQGTDVVLLWGQKRL
jgi:signal transduction histidine kinase